MLGKTWIGLICHSATAVLTTMFAVTIATANGAKLKFALMSI